MSQPRRTITFAKSNVNPDSLLNVKTEELEISQMNKEDAMYIGEYQYESDPQFGSPTEDSGEIYFDVNAGLIGIVTRYSNPGGDRLIRTINENLDASVTAPEYSQNASAQFYRTFGFNGYTTTFREDLKDYSLDSNPYTHDPEETMRERAMHSRKNPSDDWLDNITEEFIDDREYYVAYMDCVLEEDGCSLTFSNPMQISSIPEDEWGEELRDLIFERMNQLVQNNIPTVEQVTS